MYKDSPSDNLEAEPGLGDRVWLVLPVVSSGGGCGVWELVLEVADPGLAVRVAVPGLWPGVWPAAPVLTVLQVNKYTLYKCQILLWCKFGLDS